MQMSQLGADKGIKTCKQVIPMSQDAEGIRANEKTAMRFRTVLQ